MNQPEASFSHCEMLKREHATSYSLSEVTDIHMILTPGPFVLNVLPNAGRCSSYRDELSNLVVSWQLSRKSFRLLFLVNSVTIVTDESLGTHSTSGSSPGRCSHHVADL